jgi:hypothetical protein
VSDFFRGKPKSPEHIAKQTDAMKRAWGRKSPEERQAIAEKSAAKHRGQKLGPMSDEHKRKIAEAQARAWASGKRKAVPDAGARLQAASRSWWDQATPEQRAQRGAAISAAKQKSVGP